MLLESPAAASAGIVYTVLLLVIARGDVATRRIPNRLVAALAVTGLVASMTALRHSVGLVDALGGVGLGLAIWLPLWLIRAVGGGDVKMAAALGAWLGVSGVVAASILAALAGGVMAIAVLVHRRAIGRLAGDMLFWFGALRIGGMGAAVAGGRPTRETHGRGVLPYGLALAAGGLLAAWVPPDGLAWMTW